MAPGTRREVPVGSRERMPCDRCHKSVTHIAESRVFDMPNPPIHWVAEKHECLSGYAILLDRDVFRRVLKMHWVLELRCDHEKHTDTVVCACALWRCPPQPTIGEAIDAWTQHVLVQYGLESESLPPEPQP